ncbi:MAG TPA: flagellar basal body-associated FliL family protein [Stellaceae bacterium]|nr:flagellar basal body-associated FliL family protein [Stellaceae bacterium]
MAEQTLDDDVEKAPETEGGSKFKFSLDRKKLILFGGPGLLVLLLGVGGYLYFNGTVAKLMGHKAEPVAELPKPLVFFDLPDFLVNLNSGGKKSNFLKLTVSLQIDKPEDQVRLQAVLPRIIDNCQIFLRELRVEDLRGSGGIYRLREELLARINAASPVKVADVLFKEMLVQ